MIQPSISDYEASKILQEINLLSYLNDQDPIMPILTRHQNSITYWVGYLERRGRHVKRIHSSPVVYSFVGSIYDPERVTTAEHIASTSEPKMDPEVDCMTSVFSKFDEIFRQLKAKVPQPKFNYNEEIRRFVFFLQSLSFDRRIETMQHVVNLVQWEIEEEAERNKHQ